MRRTDSQSPGNIFDAFCKKVFGQFLVFADFLKHYGDPKFIAEIDLSKIKPAPTHYVGKEGDERIADLVFQCPLKNGSGTMTAVIVFEHQSGNLKKIPLKLHKYISAIWAAELKEGWKILSAPYFIVLRTGKKPHRGEYPTMSALLPKGSDGKPIGKAVDIEYDVIDLPAWDCNKLVGKAELQAVLGILQKMTNGHDAEFDEAMLPIKNIVDEKQKIEWTRELLDFIAKAMRAHNQRLTDSMVHNALEPIFKEKNMIMTIFEEREAKAKVEGKTEAILTVLRARFGKVSKTTEKTIRAISDPVALESWTIHAATCKSLSEFIESVK